MGDPSRMPERFSPQLVQDILQWDVRAWSKALRYWERAVRWEQVRNALELGGQKGGLSLWLAGKGMDVVCSDVHDVSVTARPLHSAHDVLQRIRYERINALDIPYQDHFDLVVFKSVVGGIGRMGGADAQRAVFTQIHKALKPGGMLLFAENLSASPLHRAFRRTFVQWGTSWRYPSLAELKGYLGHFASSELRTSGFFSTFGRTEGQRHALSMLDEWGPDQLLPAGWRYIAYGIAVK